MDTLTAARTSMGISLAFHIIFAALGVGLPILLMVAEGLGLRNRDAVWYALARRWGKAFGVLFVVGAVSGTREAHQGRQEPKRKLPFSFCVLHA